MKSEKARSPKIPAPPRALRPKQIHVLYGIPPSTLHHYCNCSGPDRLPSIKLPSKRGTRGKGVRLVMVADLEQWLRRYRTP